MKHSKALVWGSAVVVMACILATPVWSDTVSGRISGSVKDSQGALLVGVQVTALNTDTGISHGTKTDSQGFYAFPSLPAGNYTVSAEQAGFRKFQAVGFVLDVNSSLTVDIQLQIGQIVDQITVSASHIQVETTSTQIGEVINSEKITSVPLNGRSYTDLLALQPGVTPVTSGQYATQPVSGNLNAGSLSVAGGRESANGFMVNGANVEEGEYMGTAVIPNLDSIAEFRILTNNFDAEYGNYSGGQVNAITKSGSNAFHGDIFEFLRNTDLDARNYFAPERGSFIQNQFGGTAGGPIRRDKLFFFGDYQGTRMIQGQNSGVVPVPSTADRAGNVSDLANELTGTVDGAYWAGQLENALHYGVTSGEAYYQPGCVSDTACVFPNAVVPTTAFNPISKNILPYIPSPNLPGGGFATSSDNTTLTDDKGGIHIDYNSGFGTLSGYYFLDNFILDNPYFSSSVPGFTASTTGRAQLATIGYNRPIGLMKFNEFRLSYTRMANFAGKPVGGAESLSSLGFVTGANTLGINPLLPQFEGVPQISFNAYTIGVPGFFQGQANNTYQISDNFSIVHGTHTIRFGGSFHYDQITIHTFGADNGTFNFTGAETGSDFVDFLIGAPSAYTQGEELPLHTRTRYLGLYAQDSWRANSNLTINYGLRWDVTSPWYEANGQLETIVPGLQSQLFPGAPLGWVFPGDPGVPSTLSPTRYNNFAPRIGVAWAPNASDGFWGRLIGGPGKTSVRAGFGIFYTAFEDATGFNEVGDAPFGSYYVSPVPPEFATPFVDRATNNPEGQRFPVVLPPANVSANNPDNTVDWSQFLPISSSPGFWYKNRVPYTESYNLSIQRALTDKSILSIAYVGTQGHRLLSDLEANPGSAALCLSVSQAGQVAPGSATCGPFGENGVYTTAGGATINGTRPVLGPNFGSDGYFITIGNSNYNSLQVTWRYASGPLEFLAGYTFSKSIDDSSGWGDQINPVNQLLSRSLSSFDVPHNFVLSYRYALPFDRLEKNRFTTGWALSGITRFASGLPVTLNEPDDNSLLGTFFTGPNGNTVDTPDYTPGPLHFTNPRSGQPYFNTGLFTLESLGQIGTSPKRFFVGPGINNFDVALLKDTKIRESLSVQFRAEFFDVFNHAQFMNVNGDIDSNQFGIVTTARDPRIGQVSLKILF
jgi:hypothetical protein